MWTIANFRLAASIHVYFHNIHEIRYPEMCFRIRSVASRVCEIYHQRKRCWASRERSRCLRPNYLPLRLIILVLTIVIMREMDGGVFIHAIDFDQSL